jgi:ABC-type antimicrobial peptide transport system permease subunit
VVGGVRHVALASTPEPEFYLDERQYPQASMVLVARTAEDPMRSALSLHGLVAAIDRAVPISDLRTMDALVSRSLAQPRVVTILLFVFALVGLVLGAVGIYGVVSYAVGERVREIGIRIALGAATGSVVRMVVRAGLQFALVGIVLGLLGAAMLMRALQSLVFGVSTTDAATFALISLFLLGTAGLASWIPARRAARVDPMRTLRGD